MERPSALHAGAGERAHLAESLYKYGRDAARTYTMRATLLRARPEGRRARSRYWAGWVCPAPTFPEHPCSHWRSQASPRVRITWDRVNRALRKVGAGLGAGLGAGVGACHAALGESCRAAYLHGGGQPGPATHCCVQAGGVEPAARRDTIYSIRDVCQVFSGQGAQARCAYLRAAQERSPCRARTPRRAAA